MLKPDFLKQGYTLSSFLHWKSLMDADKKAQIQAHARAIAALLYEETDPEQVKTLAGIEEAVRDHLLEHVSPEIGNFLSKQGVAQQPDENGASTALVDG
jgi:hypothetical protein